MKNIKQDITIIIVYYNIKKFNNNSNKIYNRLSDEFIFQSI